MFVCLMSGDTVMHHGSAQLLQTTRECTEDARRGLPPWMTWDDATQKPLYSVQVTQGRRQLQAVVDAQQLHVWVVQAWKL